MTADITIGPYKGFAPAAVRWSSLMDNYMNTASITVPAICKLSGGMADADELKKTIPTAKAIAEGMQVSIAAGYDGNNLVRFTGFVSKINLSIPMVIECEGWAYKLRNVKMNKVYVNSSLKEILTDLCTGTGIALNSSNAAIPIAKADLRNHTGLQVLDWVKKNLLLAVYFTGNVLYAGLRYTGSYGRTVQHRIGWNVVSDDDLQQSELPLSTVYINVTARKKDGEYVQTETTGSDSRNVRVTGTQDAAFMQQLQADLQQQENIKGLTGSLTCFLLPECVPGMISEVSDGSYAGKHGRYIIEGVEGSFDKSGGRQKVHIGLKI